MEYLKFYEIEVEPFQNEPDERFYFESSAHRRAHLRLLRGVTLRKGLSVLIGGAGCGKTTLVHHLRSALDSEKWATKVLTITHVDCVSGWVLPQVAKAFGVLAPTGTGPELLAQIESQLASIAAEGRHPTLLVDEAQMLSSAAVMEEFRGLLNLNRDGKKLISLVLYGLNELADVLELDAPLLQRVEIRVELLCLPKAEIGRYVAHRLKCAGARRDLFTADAIEALAAYSDGVPRLVNTLADNALFEGYVSEASTVDGSLVVQAAEDLGLRPATERGAEGAADWVESIVPQAETDFGNSISLGEPRLAPALASPAGPSSDALVPEAPDLDAAPDCGNTLRAEAAFADADPSNELTQIAGSYELENGFSMGSIVHGAGEPGAEIERPVVPGPEPGTQVGLDLELEKPPAAAGSSTHDGALFATRVVDAAAADGGAEPGPPDGESSFILGDPAGAEGGDHWGLPEDTAVGPAETSGEAAAPTSPADGDGPESEFDSIEEQGGDEVEPAGPGVSEEALELEIRGRATVVEPDSPDEVKLATSRLPEGPAEAEEELFVGGEDSISGAVFEPSSMLHEEPGLEEGPSTTGEDSMNGAEFELSTALEKELDAESGAAAPDGNREAHLDLAGPVGEGSEAEPGAAARGEDDVEDPELDLPVVVQDDSQPEPQAVTAGEDPVEEDFDPSRLVEEALGAEPEPVSTEEGSVEDGEFDPSSLLDEDFETEAGPVAAQVDSVEDGEFDPSSLLDEDGDVAEEDEIENLFEEIQIDT